MIGLAQAMNYIGKKTVVAMREPSLGPCFGVKGGAAGGGYAQVVPMEDINLHFTGDIHAITAAHNLISAMLDNSIHQGNPLDIDVRTIVWKRVVDLNDRALRHITVGLGGKANGVPREDGFDITVASEIMAILCLANDLMNLKARVALCFGSFLTLWACLAFKLSGEPFHAGNNIIGMLGLCGVAGALTASIVGSYVRKLGVRKLNYIGCTLIILAWCIMWLFQTTYIGFIVGIVIIDIGMQCVQISNQTCALSLVPQASNRVNTIFMTTYFIGGSLGTFLAGSFWHVGGWAGVAAVGATLPLQR